ncbi:Gfo/Idh/MocA family protein [Luteipulveratus flavus]|uniref:Gfo/Idh/MocA family oxidoreductase n=1 Tax=Luteipulveratus flavus TaxID=3031728 RepID=A0ABT6CBC7_9MICO|nr:Gfo/Idh/MocA family oxidoreductase [Luteipulveratus sp. YIM 133296]MDF8266189.1 Gfo/Idh/MocA family oxidoreductase [Luteipulveratus sp. YIM 133296]
MAATSLPQPRTPDPMDAPPLRWGVLGPGWIASEFVAALQHGTRQRVVAAGSRDLGRAQQFADRFGGFAAYGSYEELVAAPEVDVVYVASPHSEHHEHARLALEAGKHVLVEKAFTRNRAEAREVINLARLRGLFCMEAMWARFLPHYDIVRRAVEDGVLGRLQTVVADHGQRLYPDGPERLTSPDLAGGALLDLNVYPISFAAMVIPQIASVHASGTLTDEGVDAQEVVALIGESGETAACISTMTAQTANTAVVAGDSARIEIDGWFYQPNTVRLVATGGEELDRWEPAPDDRDHGLRHEAAEVARCISEGRHESALMPWEETLRVMGVMDEVRRQLGVVFPGEQA